MDADFVDNVENRSIYDLARECDCLFDEYLRAPRLESEFIEQNRRRFLSWVSFLGVFAPQDVSLDTRLRYKPDIRGLVMLLLNVLRRNMRRAIKTPNSSMMGIIKFNIDHPSDSGSLAYGIDGSIDRLHRLAIRIRQSSKDGDLREALKNWSELETQPKPSKRSGPTSWGPDQGSSLLGTYHLETPKPPSLASHNDLREALKDWSEIETQPRPSKRSGPTSWGPDQGSSLLGTDYLETLKPPSLSSHGSIVNDYGDTKHLEEHRELAQKDELIAHSGATFQNTLDRPKSRESHITIDDDATTPETILSQVNFDQSTEEQDLGLAIRASFEVSAEKERKEFLPLDALNNTVTSNRIRRELEKLGINPPEKLEQLTNKIWEISSPSSGTKTTRRKILAILALIKKVEKIVDFIKEDLYDSDLPFILSNGKKPGTRQLDRKGKNRKLEAIQLFNEWEVHELESFEHNQWHLLAPYFHLSTKEDPKVLHYNLDHQIILPFTEDNEVKHEGGGFGDVWKVTIHPAHHTYCHDLATHNENPPFAVKRLRHDNYDAFNAEVSNLKRFAAKDHLHLIKLLLTFHWHGQYYLLFPWADGNLLDFWKMYPSSTEPSRDYQLALWLSEQCLGIAEGLKMIHTADKPTPADPTHDSTYQLHGRHGDLKPENILWFRQYLKEPDQSCLMGLLKISDFGLTSFHRTMSRSHIDAGGVPVSPTYRAPEYDVAKMLSQSYDIWSFGCVVLQFVAWYLLGWEEVDRFSQNRTKEDNSEVKEDVFFNFVIIKDGNGRAQTAAIAKQSVVDEFRNLCNHEKCSDFLADLLEFVEKGMLRMGPKKRAGCDAIVSKFADLHRLCLADPDYCTKRLQVPPHRAATDLSVLKASALGLSPEMDKRIKRAGLPEHTGPLENDYQTPDAKKDGNARNSNEILGPIAKVKAAAEGKRLNSVASTSSNTESQNSRPQSPNKKVHFTHNLQPPSQGTSKPEPSTDVSESEQENQATLNPDLRDGKHLASAA
ncbi:kinase-like protein [Stipitochalara longipes BDJ]|nr:kinase-like protein [Stipitochalara longipes BDJ]